MKTNPTIYTISIVLLLLYFALRLPLVDSIPPFIDEGIAIEIERSMVEQSPLFAASEGRLLSFWYAVLFQPFNGSGFWLIRTGGALMLVLNVAILMRMGRSAAGTSGMVLAFVLFALNPFFLFFGSVALADVIALPFLMLAVWRTFSLQRGASLIDAALVGALLFLAANAKISYLPYVLVPIIGALTLRPPERSWSRQLLWVAVSLGVFTVLYGGFAAVQYWRGYAPLNILLRGSGGEAPALSSLIMQAFERTFTVIGIHIGFVGWAAGVVSLLMVLIYAWKRDVYLPLVLIVPGATVLVSQQFFSRYIYAHVMLVMLMSAVVLAGWMRHRIGRFAVPAAVMLWVLLMSAPFYWTFRAAPLAVAISEDDFSEYFAADSAGTGIPEITAFLIEQDAQQVIGLLPGCLSLKYYALNDVDVMCPRINPNGEDIPAHVQLIEDSRAPGVMVVHENSPYVPETINGEAVYVFERPGGLTTLTVFDLSP